MDVLLNKNCLKHLMNGIQSKNHITGITKSTKFLCHALMIKIIFSIMDLTGQLLVFRVYDSLSNLRKICFLCFGLVRRAFFVKL